MIFFRVAYYVVVIIAAAAGLVNTLQLRGQGHRLEAVERVRDRIRDRLMRTDEANIEPELQLAQARIVDLQDRMTGLEELLDEELKLLYIELAHKQNKPGPDPDEVQP